jgi:hypothetical protein
MPTRNSHGSDRTRGSSAAAIPNEFPQLHALLPFHITAS